MGRALLLLLALAIPARADKLEPHQQLAHDIFKELVEIDTSQSKGDTNRAARAMAARLRAAGFPAADVKAIQTAPKRGNLVARLRGTGKQKPMLLVAHLDVVEAKREDWTTDPYKLVEKDGFYYGRGTTDDKYQAAVWVANLIRFKKEKYRPDRDLILVLECDEEISDEHKLGMRFLIEKHRALIDAELAINEGGPVGTKGGKPLTNAIQTTEKLFQSFWLETRHPGGHSSQPGKDNAIYTLANGLVRLEKLAFPLQLDDTTRAFFDKMSKIETGQVAADMKSIASAKPDPAAVDRLSALPPYNAQMRTTCVATRLEGGHADNALPQLARAMINCRLVPGHRVEDVQKTIERTLADPKIVVTPVAADSGSAPSPLRPDLVQAAEKLSAKFWPGITVLPTMSTGATDGRFLRNAGIPTYGHSGLAGDIFEFRAHGKDERVAIDSFYKGQQYLYELVKLLAGGA